MFRKSGRIVVRVLRDANDGTNDGGGSTQRPVTRETFSREYVHELREENKTTRLKLQEAEAAAKAAKEAAEKVTREAEERVTTATTAVKTAADQRVIKAELKALAIKEGMIDLDDLSLVDTSKIKINEDGTLEGAEDVLKKFKESKPHKFGKASSSDTTPPPKKEGDGDPKKVKDMTPEERKAEARRLGIKL